MKKIKWMSLLLIIVSCLAFTLSACGGENDDKGKLDTTDSSKVLVAYFSATGNTQKVAGYLAEATSGDLYEIVPEVPYTDEDIDYGSNSSRTYLENRDPAARPAISGSVENMKDHDVIFLGYPIWYGNAPKIIYTFLESYSFSGKTIIPFCTSASSGIGSSANDLHALTSGATWQSGMRFSSNAKQGDVLAWLKGSAY